MLLIGAVVPLLASLVAAPQHNPVADSVAVVRRIAATAQLAAQEYRIGVSAGRIVAPQEVAEASLFLKEARRAAGSLDDSAHATVSQIDSLVQLIASTASPDSVDGRVASFSMALASRFGVTLDEPPAIAPSLQRGAEIYRTTCAGCHGESGGGDGPLAARLDPPPADLTKWDDLRDQSPLDYYRRISIGTVGTAMPPFEHTLAPADRWAVALYASTLRLPAPAGGVPSSLRPFGVTGKMSDAEILTALGKHDSLGPPALTRVAAVRSFQGDSGAAATAAVFDHVRDQVDSAFALARTGDPAAPTVALDAYMTFEQVERALRARDPAIAAEVEAAFSELRTSAGSGAATPAQLKPIEGRLAVALERAERSLGDEVSPLNFFIQSFVIMLREGLEAILIVGALMTFLSRMGASHRKREINAGVGAAVLASLVTAFLLETIFILSPARREALEGGTMLVAAVVLFYVSYWLLSKMEVVKWNHFVKSKVQDALTGGSALALASAAFLAVYREGFETVLFYKALFVSASSAGAMPVLAGMIAGALVLVCVYVAIDRFGLRLPLKPFFAVTSTFLYYMAFVFAGNGISDLQEGGGVPTTVVSWAPRIPALGIYPTLESLAAQGVLVLLALAALVWIFLVAPRRQGHVEGTRQAPAEKVPASTPQR